MNKSIIFLAILLSFYVSTKACTIIPSPFCSTMTAHSGDVIVTGEIISIDADGIDLQIIDILRGNESNAIIRIWDGTDFECNGPWSMAASDLGALSDTIVIILPKITAIENAWDVIGDYRRPDPYHYISSLKVENDVVLGLIKGDPFWVGPPNVNSYDYQTFKQDIIEDGDCASIVDVANVDDGPVFSINNPFDSKLNIRLDNVAEETDIQLFSLSGKLVMHQSIAYQQYIDLMMDDLEKGVYFLKLSIKGKGTKVVKVIKQ